MDNTIDKLMGLIQWNNMSTESIRILLVHAWEYGFIEGKLEGIDEAFNSLRK